MPARVEGRAGIGGREGNHVHHRADPGFAAVAVGVGAVVVLELVVGDGVGALEVAQHPGRPGEAEGARRPVGLEQAGDVDEAAGDDHHRLVDGAPEVGPLAELPGQVGRVLAELANRRPLEPPSGLELRQRPVRVAAGQRRPGRQRVMEPGRERPVMQGHERGQAPAGGRSQDPQVVAHRPSVGAAIEPLEVPAADPSADLDPLGRAREDSWPFDRESEGVVAQILRREVEVGAEQAPVTGAVLGQLAADDSSSDVARIARPDEPVAVRVEVPAATRLGLKARERRTPKEPRWELSRALRRRGGCGGGHRGEQCNEPGEQRSTSGATSARSRRSGANWGSARDDAVGERCVHSLGPQSKSSQVGCGR